MVISFLIGNGLDLGLGLNTKYKDFADIYLNQSLSDPLFLLLKKESPDGMLWKDLELAIGSLSAKIVEKDKDAYIKGVYSLTDQLLLYLQKEEKRFSILNQDDFGIELAKNLRLMKHEFSKSECQKFDSAIESNSNIETINFITFNYTDCLSRMVESFNVSKQRINAIAKDTNTKTIVDRMNITNPLFIHGSLEDKEMILGVGTEDQIGNSSFRKDPDFRRLIIKKELNEGLENEKISETKKIIDASLYVCLFGLSMGQTDFYWWSYIASWLSSNVSRKLVIFETQPSDEGQFAAIRLDRKEEIKRKFKEAAKLNDYSFLAIVPRIIVVRNPSTLNFTKSRSIKITPQQFLWEQKY